MLQGYTTPRTPKGTSSLAPAPPWHYVSTSVAIEFDADPARVAAFLPDGLEPAGGRCAVYFAEWQFATDRGDEYLDPVGSQYKEMILLVSAKRAGVDAAYCPFIFVDQDIALMRGLVQGWPKQLGSVWLTRAFPLNSIASPRVEAGGRFGASLAVKDRRLVEAKVTLNEKVEKPPSPGFAHAFNLRYFPDLAAGRHNRPAVHELVQLKSRDVRFGDIWTGDASLTIFDHPTLELAELTPTRVIAGYQFSFAFTVDDLVHADDFTKA